MLFIITGKRDSGKTKLIAALVHASKNGGLNAGGFFSPCEMDARGKNLYYACDAKTLQKKLLVTRTGQGPLQNEEGIVFACGSLNNKDCSVVFIDEIGPLEFSGRGVVGALTNLDPQKNTVITMREKLIPQADMFFRNFEKRIFNLDNLSFETVYTEVLKCLLK